MGEIALGEPPKGRFNTPDSTYLSVTQTGDIEAMLVRHRGTLTLLTLAAVACALAGGALWAWSLPVDPETASRAQWMRSLVLQDLSTLPPGEQAKWVERVQAELTGEFLPDEVAGVLTSSQTTQLARNAALLQDRWFSLRCAQYATLPEEQRPTFMQRQMALIEAWPKIASLTEPSPADQDSANSLISQIDTWIAQAKEPLKSQMIAAVHDGVLHWLTTSDLAEQPREMQQALAERLAVELRRSRDQSQSAALHAALQSAQFQQNVERLLQAYVQSLAAQFAVVPKEQQTAWLDQELAAIQASGIIELLSELPANKQSHVPPTLQLASHMQAWIERTPSDEREQVNALVVAAQQRMVKRLLPSWLRK